MGVLALLYLGIGMLEDNPVGALNNGTLPPAEFVITFVFFAEFALRCYVAPSRRRYLKAHWIDLLALVPMVRWLRITRLARFIRLIEMARVLRFGVLIRVLVELERVVKGMRRVAERNGVHVFLIIALCLVVAGGTLVWELEHTINPSFSSYADAIWWAFATMSTVGYGNGPVTLAGRAIAAVIMIVGIASFGAVTATVTTYFVQQPPSDPEPSPHEVMAVLEDIRARLDRLEQDRRADSILPSGATATTSPPGGVSHAGYEASPLHSQPSRRSPAP